MALVVSYSHFWWYRERCTTLQTSNTTSHSFYIVLTSDASRDQCPENMAADFTMQLKSQLNLSEDWEVAMTRIIYPYSWQNVREHQLSYTLLCKTSALPWTLTIYLPSGIYRTVKFSVRKKTQSAQDQQFYSFCLLPLFYSKKLYIAWFYI